jgi:hypothetical protein
MDMGKQALGKQGNIEPSEIRQTVNHRQDSVFFRRRLNRKTTPLIALGKTRLNWSLETIFS